MARRGASEDPKVAALREARCLNPHPEAGDRRGVPAPGVLRRPRRGAGQVRDGAAVRVDGGRSPPRRRRSGTPGRPTTQAAAALDEHGPGRAGAGQARAARRAQAHRRRCAPSPSKRWPPTPACGRRDLAGPDRGALRRARAPPLDRAALARRRERALQKPLTCPPASPERRTPVPVPATLTWPRGC